MNGIWRAVNNRVLKSKEYREWLDAAAIELAKQPSLPGPCYWRADILMPSGQTDLDNLCKGTFDALHAAKSTPDDRYLVDFRMRFHDGDKVEIVVKSEPTGLWAAIRRASAKLARKLSTYDSEQTGMNL